VERQELIKGFVQLGKLMVALGEGKPWEDFSIGVTQVEYERLNGIIGKQFFYNGWFTTENVRFSLKSLGSQMTPEGLTAWTGRYAFSDYPKRVAIIMAGNIPLVGFHDFFCVILSGNIAVCKLSSDDKTLLPALAEVLVQFVPGLKDRIEFTTGRVGQMEAVIATGSDNSLNYFEQYFGKYPHVFRRNRTSIAVLNGGETREDIHQLGHDIFDYFGLGCRNVSHLLLPEGFELNRFFEGILEHSNVVNNNKYANNYDYNKAIFLLNKQELLDNHFVLLKESKELFSPLAVVHYHYYTSQEDLNDYLETHKDQIQAVIGKEHIPFGKAQCPMLDDYADGVDTMRFLETLIQ
jgi:hypothetical protein